MLDNPMDETANRVDRPAGRPGLVADLLTICGVAVALGAALWAGLSIFEQGRAPSPSGLGLVTALAVLVAGVAAGVLLWAIGQLLRRLGDIVGLLENRGERAPIFHSAPAQTASVLDEGRLNLIITLLRELRDITMLSEAERSKRLETQGRALALDLQRDVPKLLRDHRWREARRRVQEARERFPTFAELEALERQIENVRAQVEAHDITQAERQIADLSALEAWERAADVVRELLERHPDSEKVNALEAQVRLRYEKSQAEQRSRLMAAAQEAARNRDWQAAIAAAQQVMQRFPRSAEAEALRLQLPVMHENAEIRSRQIMEERIKEQIRQQRFTEALALAHQLIDRYPGSPQAEVLRGQLPKLQQRAAALAR